EGKRSESSTTRSSSRWHSTRQIRCRGSYIAASNRASCGALQKSSWRTGQLVSAPELASDQRWPNRLSESDDAKDDLGELLRRCNGLPRNRATRSRKLTN